MALLLDGPAAADVNGLRRALGDSSLDLVAPHLTLVPPVNVRRDELDEAVAVLRRAAAAQPGPLPVSLGPVSTFLPDSPVIYLAVGATADVRASLQRLHGSVLDGPLRRPERWPWVPHVTLADDARPDRLAAAVLCLDAYRLEVQLDRLVLMEERERSWGPLADACLGPPVVVGRGGLPIEIVEGNVLGPDALALLSSTQAVEVDLDAGGADRVVLTANREGATAGVATAWLPRAPGSALRVLVVVGAHCRRQGVGRALLAALEMSVRRRRWSTDGALGLGPPAFYENSAGWLSPG